MMTSEDGRASSSQRHSTWWEVIAQHTQGQEKECSGNPFTKRDSEGASGKAAVKLCTYLVASVSSLVHLGSARVLETSV